MTKINAYLTFNGNCEEAFNFYASIFSEQTPTFSRFKEFQSEDMGEMSEGEKIMHVALPIGHGTVLMGSDSLEAMGGVTIGTNFSLALEADSKEAADRFYSRLSAGGEATMPLDQAPWGAYFGMCTDQFGIQWMVNYDHGQG